jgi:hypothetical protein
MKIISYRIILTFLLILSINILLVKVSYSQVTEEWVRYFNSGSSNNDNVTAMALDTNGNIIVTGWIQTTNQNANFCTVKYNPLGVFQWSAIYNGPGSNSIDQAKAIATDKQGNIYVTGNSESGGLWTDDYCIVKYSASGVQLWVARYNGADNGPDDPFGIAVDKFSNVYVTGRSMRANGWNDWLTVKYDSSGNYQWAKYYNGPDNNDEGATSIAADDSCNIYVGGGRKNISYEATVIKYNTNGVQQWLTTYGISGHNISGDYLLLDKFNNIYLSGSDNSSVTEKYCTIKYNNSGIQQWVANYTSPTNGSSHPYGMAIDSNLNILITGRSFQTSNAEYVTVKYNNNGIQQWVQIYNGPGNSYDEAHDICVDIQGNSYITGRSSIPENQFVTIKYNPNGVQQWIMGKQGAGVAVAVDKSFNVFVSGSSTGNGLDYTVIKYNQPVNITSNSSKIPSSINLGQNYPNPFNPVTTIRFSIPNNPETGKSYATLIVYDALGREINKIVNDYFNVGEYRVQFDGSTLSSGMYFYKLTINEFQQTKTMILIK